MTLGFFKSIAWVAFALVLTGCASGQRGLVLVEKRWWNTQMAACMRMSARSR